MGDDPECDQQFNCNIKAAKYRREETNVGRFHYITFIVRVVGLRVRKIRRI